MQFLRRRGSSHTEYVLIAAVVSIAIITGAMAIGGSLNEFLTAVSDVLAAVSF